MAVGRMGWAAYARILGAIWAEPMSSEACAKRFDRGDQKMRELLWRMERAGLVRVCEWVKSERTIESHHSGMFIPVFARPCGMASLPYPNKIERRLHGDTDNLRKPRPEFLAFTVIIDTMREGATRQEIRDESGAAHHRISQLLLAMREVGLVHTAGWRRNAGGACKLAEVVRFGPGRNVKRPPPKPRREVEQDYYARLRVARAAARAAKRGAGALAMHLVRRTVVADGSRA